MKGTLYIVSLPIGNSYDISLRALKTLQNSDLIAAEDTRVFKAFSLKHQIKYKKLISYYKNNERPKKIISELKKGLDVCLVSDSGTPRISDPGDSLVNLCYKEKISVKSVPGASSLTAALSVCPFRIESFYFLGFLQPKKLKESFEKVKDLETLLLMFEAPHRLIKHLELAKQVFSRNLFVAREITKTYEENVFGSIEEVQTHFKNKPIKGEFVLVYSKPITLSLSANDIKFIAKNNQTPTKELSKELRKKTKLSSSSIYKIIHDERK